jgi:hypothetical protein
MKKSNSKKDVKSVKIVTASLDKEVTVNREACTRQAICKQANKTTIDKRLSDCRVSHVMSANNFTVNSQAQLIDLIVRSANSVLSVNEIAKQVILHKDCIAVFKREVDFVTVLKRVKRHCMIYDNMQARVIKRNSYTL